MQEAENRPWTIAKDNLTSDTFLASTHTRTAQNFWKFLVPWMHISRTQTNAQHHQMHDPPWRPQTLAQSLPHTRTHEYTYKHTCVENTLYVYAVVYAVCIHIYGHAFTSHTWSWIFVLETPSVSLHSAPIHSNQPYPNVMQGISLSSVKVQWHHSWISWGCIFLKYQLSWIENCS